MKEEKVTGLMSALCRAAALSAVGSPAEKADTALTAVQKWRYINDKQNDGARKKRDNKCYG